MDLCTEICKLLERHSIFCLNHFACQFILPRRGSVFLTTQFKLFHCSSQIIPVKRNINMFFVKGGQGKYTRNIYWNDLMYPSCAQCNIIRLKICFCTVPVKTEILCPLTIEFNYTFTVVPTLSSVWCPRNCFNFGNGWKKHLGSQKFKIQTNVCIALKLD